MRSTLEQERNIILEKIHASREIYRQILAPQSAAADRKTMPSEFPRSRTFQWIMDRPWITISGVAAVLWLIVNRVSYNRRIKHRTKNNSASLRPIKALLAISAMLLQNPSRLQTVGRLAGTILKWLKK